MPRLPPRPDLDFASGAPHSRDHGDVYFSREGLSEKRVVFLEGCGLPEAWQERERFTVGELGFGTGLNLLAAWDLWRRHRPSPGARLDYLSFEGALMSAGDAARVHALWPELANLSGALLAKWPDRARGVQRIMLGDGVTLTLFVNDIAAALPEANASIDAWFLDGFAPSKNPEMWSAQAMAHVARLSAPGARAATYTVAGDVRRNLEAAGFAVEKKPGHGRKKERLEERFRDEGKSPPPRGEGRSDGGPQNGKLSRSVASHAVTAPRPYGRRFAAPPAQGGGGAPKSIVVIGAGIAGACAAHAFLKRGCEVTVIDRAAAPGAGASGNPLALVMPRLDAADTPESRALVEAWLYARRFYAALGSEGAVQLDAVHRPRGEKEHQRFSKLLSDPPLDEAVLRPLDPENSSAGVRHLGAIAVRPSEALPRLLAGVRLRFDTAIRSLDEIEADLVLVCAGMGAPGIAGVAAPPLTGRLGQLECASSSGAPNAVADGGYAVEAFGQLVFGATFEAANGEPAVTSEARAKNLETLARLRPGLDPGPLVSRASNRATTQDRFPFCGPPPNQAPGNEKALDADPAPLQCVRLIGGLGARGFLWAPLLAELSASEAFNEPLPVEASVAKALDPGRFLQRSRRRAGG
jgi:tRNA 5-methylaminomethyl-2-thiouridine biosynthesis bifunctional protein